MTDEDVKKLCDCLSKNTTFVGELNLCSNSLTDLSGLYIANAMKTFKGLKCLNLAKNNLHSKTAQYIGEVLINNPEYDIEELNFKGNQLEEYGLRRLIAATVANPHIKKLKLGIISDFGLDLLTTDLLNTSLVKLEFEEDADHPFSERVRDRFVDAFKQGIENAEDFTIEKIE